jgi:hypothetical protein
MPSGTSPRPARAGPFAQRARSNSWLYCDAIPWSPIDASDVTLKPLKPTYPIRGQPQSSIRISPQIAHRFDLGSARDHQTSAILANIGVVAHRPGWRRPGEQGP